MNKTIEKPSHRDRSIEAFEAYQRGRAVAEKDAGADVSDMRPMNDAANGLVALANEQIDKLRGVGERLAPSR